MSISTSNFHSSTLMDPGNAKESLQQESEIHPAGLTTFTHLRIDKFGLFNEKHFTGIFRRSRTFPAARSSSLFCGGRGHPACSAEILGPNSRFQALSYASAEPFS
ncbi:hypothetical protein M413DRAFT_368810 [Hebeloma cylindrosporum]|uniref:Uncharacterized protein n=1 Tax=Hebeloma cylindrosporum TaxID=76867 RepID=A0A0C2XB35_HEBCY|nr:hypothetical protein M413DRAFT_368810 [Hebeloma cylindrosporum h7]